MEAGSASYYYLESEEVWCLFGELKVEEQARLTSRKQKLLKYYISSLLSLLLTSWYLESFSLSRSLSSLLSPLYKTSFPVTADITRP